MTTGQQLIDRLGQLYSLQTSSNMYPFLVVVKNNVFPLQVSINFPCMCAASSFAVILGRRGRKRRNAGNSITMRNNVYDGHIVSPRTLGGKKCEGKEGEGESADDEISLLSLADEDASGRAIGIKFQFGFGFLFYFLSVILIGFCIGLRFQSEIEKSAVVGQDTEFGESLAFSFREGAKANPNVRLLSAPKRKLIFGWGDEKPGATEFKPFAYAKNIGGHFWLNGNLQDDFPYDCKCDPMEQVEWLEGRVLNRYDDYSPVPCVAETSNALKQHNPSCDPTHQRPPNWKYGSKLGPNHDQDPPEPD